jgi:sugar phosphate permease
MNRMHRHFPLILLTLAAGAIYPVVYLRQSFEGPILEHYALSLAQLNELYSLLGVIFIASYLPSGWLADRYSVKHLIVTSLFATGVLSIAFMFASHQWQLTLIYAAWGVSTGLTFWSALIKAVGLLAPKQQEGRYYAFLEGGRGLVEALLATLALGLFALASHYTGLTKMAPLQTVIGLYASALLLMTLVTAYYLPSDAKPEYLQRTSTTGLLSALGILARNRALWLATFCVLTGYQFLWATYSFAGFLQSEWSLTATTTASIALAKLWTRPLGAFGAGWLARSTPALASVLSYLMVLAAILLVVFALFPRSATPLTLAFLAMSIGFFAYGVRGIYWATLSTCDIEDAHKGLAIGCVSLIAFTPDIYLPILNTTLLEMWPGRAGHAAYFGFIAGAGLIGGAAARRLA